MDDTATQPRQRQAQQAATVLVVGFRPGNLHAHRSLMDSSALDIVTVSCRPLPPAIDSG